MFKPISSGPLTTKFRAKPRNGPQIEILITISVVILTLLALLLLWRTGINSRSLPSAAPRIFLLSQEREAYAVWRNLNVRGRVLIHFGEHMPIKLISAEKVGQLAQGNKASFERAADIETAILDSNNYIYAASRANYVRKIVGVVPDARWQTLKARFEESSGFEVSDDSLRGWVDGLPMTTVRLETLPPLDEPVLVGISKDYFLNKAATPSRVLSALQRTRLQFDIVTIALPPKDHREYEKAMKKTNEFRSYLEAIE